MSYIVKNCPAKYYAGATNMKCSELGGDCDTKTDCILKQIVELCNDVKEEETDPLNSFGIALAQKILDLFDIQECE